jgi:predicted hydrocarbon binding protein
VVVDSPDQADYKLSVAFSTSFLNSLDELLGENGVKVIHKMADLSLPESHHELAGITLAFDEFSALQDALEQIYGDKGSLSIARRAGRMTLEKMIMAKSVEGGSAPGIFSSVNQFMEFLNGNLGDVKFMVSTIEGELGIFLDPCPECRNRTSDHPVCNSILGFLEAGLETIEASPYSSIVEHGCIGAGHTHCEFRIS